MSQYKSDGGWTHKQVARYLKSKGRGKLHNYCTMCRRQFRDNGGLEVHMKSKSHLERMREFNANPDHFLKKFSDDFQEGFLGILKRRYGTQRIFARTVYEEYARILHHRHLNSTVWPELSDFVKYLGESGICNVSQDDKSGAWLVQYIETDEDRAAAERRETVEVDETEEQMTEEEAHLRLIQRQQQRMSRRSRPKKRKRRLSPADTSSLARPASRTVAPLSISLNVDASHRNRSNALLTGRKRQRTPETNDDDTPTDPSLLPPPSKRRRLSPTTTSTSSSSRSSHRCWLRPNLIVKILHRTFSNGEFYKKKAKVLSVDSDRREAELEIIRSGDVVSGVSQKYLETVIPAVGRRVVLVRYFGDLSAGSVGVVRGLSSESKSDVRVRVVMDGNGDLVEFPLESVCKIVE